MQRHQRIRHRWMWLVLLPVALAAFAYALLNRGEMPTMDKVPRAGEEEPR